MVTKYEMEMQERHLFLLEKIARSLEKLNREHESRAAQGGRKLKED